MVMRHKPVLGLVAGGEVDHRGTPFGANVETPEISQMVAMGMGRVANAGTLTTPIAGGGAAAIMDIDRPRMAIGVPRGYTIRPIMINVQVQLGAIVEGNESESLIAADIYGLWSGDGSFTSQDPVNMRSDLGEGSACRVGTLFTADMTTTPKHPAAAADPELDMELSRLQTEWDVLTVGQVDRSINHLYEPRNPPYIVGPATLLVYFGGDVANVGGFIQAAWVEGRNEDFF